MDSGRITNLLLISPTPDERSWSGSKSAKSTYSKAIIFCTTFWGSKGQPGKEVLTGLARLGIWTVSKDIGIKEEEATGMPAELLTERPEVEVENNGKLMPSVVG